MNEPADSFRRVSFEIRDGVMAGLAFGPERADPDIVFLHATGMNARSYRAMLAPLGERYAVWALDFRGHGLSTLPPRRWGYNSWRVHRDDVIQVLERYVSKPVTLAGHSLGGAVSLLTAGRRPDLAASLALIDPVILPASYYAWMELPFGPLISRSTMPIARNAARRRADFPDREAAVAAFTGRGIFKAFTREMIEDYVGDGLVAKKKGGGMTLACTPAYESATFAAQRHDPWGALRRVSCPLVVLRAENRSTLPAAALHKFEALRPDARIATVEGAGHMLPMERPDRVRSAIETAVLMAPRPSRETEEI